MHKFVSPLKNAHNNLSLNTPQSLHHQHTGHTLGVGDVGAAFFHMGDLAGVQQDRFIRVAAAVITHFYNAIQDHKDFLSIILITAIGLVTHVNFNTGHPIKGRHMMIAPRFGAFKTFRINQVQTSRREMAGQCLWVIFRVGCEFVTSKSRSPDLDKSSVLPAIRVCRKKEQWVFTGYWQ